MAERIYEVKRRADTLPWCQYLTLDESYAVRDDAEIYTGRVYRIFNQVTGEEIR